MAYTFRNVDPCVVELLLSLVSFDKSVHPVDDMVVHPEINVVE